MNPVQVLEELKIPEQNWGSQELPKLLCFKQILPVRRNSMGNSLEVPQVY